MFSYYMYDNDPHKIFGQRLAAAAAAAEKEREEKEGFQKLSYTIAKRILSSNPSGRLL
jgi:hypothetical protein